MLTALLLTSLIAPAHAQDEDDGDDLGLIDIDDIDLGDLVAAVKR